MSISTQRKYHLMRLLEERDGLNCSICELPLRDDRHPNELRKRRGKGRNGDGGHGNKPLATTLDHITPEVHGGLSKLENLRLSHKICNSMRGHAELSEKLKEKCQLKVKEIRNGKEG
jgi:hypothetical protein